MQAYQRILRDHLGINFYIVRADAGNIGGNMSHEYHIPCKTGHDSIVYCAKCHLGQLSAMFSISLSLNQRHLRRSFKFYRIILLHIRKKKVWNIIRRLQNIVIFTFSRSSRKHLEFYHICCTQAVFLISLENIK